MYKGYLHNTLLPRHPRENGDLSLSAQEDSRFRGNDNFSGFIAFVFSILLLCNSALAFNVQQHLPSAQKIGEGRLTYFVWDVYDARLYAPDGEWNPEQPFALTLHYLRDLDGNAIADRSVEEMRKQGHDDEVQLAAWHSQMREIFPDVSNGTELTGVYTPGEATRFYKNEQLIGSVRDAEFGQWFFNIWLSEKTTEPELRSQLLGLNDD